MVQNFSSKTTLISENTINRTKLIKNILPILIGFVQETSEQRGLINLFGISEYSFLTCKNKVKFQ